MEAHNRDKYSETRSQIGDAGGTWKSLQKSQCLRDQEDSGANPALQRDHMQWIPLFLLNYNAGLGMQVNLRSSP